MKKFLNLKINPSYKLNLYTYIALTFIILIWGTSTLSSEKPSETKAVSNQTSEKSVSPQRIISLSPNLTEILFALGLDEQIVAVTDFCQYPPETEKKKKIGGLMNPNLELIIALKPDLIIMLNSNSDLKAKLTSLKTKFLIVKNETIADVMESITTIGEATGKKKEASNLLKKFTEKLNRTTERVANLPKVKVLIVVDKHTDTLQGMYCAAKGNFINEMVEIAGGINVLSESTTPYPIISKEKLIELNPDVILDMSIYGNKDEQDNKKVSDNWKSLYSINAVKNNRIYHIDPTSITIPGPRIPDNIEHIAKLIHNL